MLEATIDPGLFHPISFKSLASTFLAPFLRLHPMYVNQCFLPLVTH